MRRLLYVMLLFPFISLSGQWSDGYFNVIYQHDFEGNTVGDYLESEWADDWYEGDMGLSNKLLFTDIVDRANGKSLKWDFPNKTFLLYKHLDSVRTVDGEPFWYTVGPTQGEKWYAFVDEAGTEYEELYFSFDIMFKPGFNWVRSGKIPSLQGEDFRNEEFPGPYYEDGYRSGLRWDDGGRLYYYLYTHNFRGDEENFTTWGPVCYDPTRTNPGTPFKFPVDEETWVHVTQRVVMNSVNGNGEYGNPDGIMEVFINGKLSATLDTVIWRNVEEIGGSRNMRMHATFGGDNGMFACTRDEWILIDNVRAWTYDQSVEGVPRGRETSEWGRILNLPASWSNALLAGNEPEKDSISPTVPSNIQVDKTTENSISLSWSSSTDNVKVTGYRIFVDGILIGATTNKSYEVTALNPDTEYKISITAIDAAGNESSQSVAITVSTPEIDRVPPTIPENLRITGNTGTSVSITWNQSTDNVMVTGYRIFRNGGQVGTSVNNSYTLTDLNPDTDYEIRVSAFDANGNQSLRSDALVITTAGEDTESPTAPQGLQALTIGEESIGLAWSASSDNVGVAGYRIIANGLIRGTSFSNSYTLIQLNPGIQYVISVVAFDDSGNESEPSNEIIVRTTNPDQGVMPSLPEVELLALESQSTTAQATSEVKSFGHTEMQDYGILISEDVDQVFNGMVHYGISDPTLVMHEKRVIDDLLLMYDFSESEGTQIHDISNTTSIDLSADKELNIIWQPGQGLKVADETILKSTDSPDNLIEAIEKSGEITVEAWIKTSAVNQTGPARIITLSKNSDERIFTLGQVGNGSSYRYSVRLNTSMTDENGIPEIVTNENFVNPGLHHIVYTRDVNGNERLYVNGFESYAGKREGDLNWDSGYQLALANEITGDRPWLGTYYLVAMYGKSLSYNEVARNFEAGLGTFQYRSEVLGLTPNLTYYISPFVRTDQGVVYGKTESIRIESIRIDGLQEDKDTLLMAVYPNPSSGEFTVEFEDTEKSSSNAVLQITDQSGQIMFTKRYNLPADIYAWQETLNLSDVLQSRGIYSVIVIMGSRSAARKLIIV